MLGNVLRNTRVVDGRQVQEPTLLALGLNAAGFLLLLALLAAAVVVRFMRRPRPVAPVTGRQRWLRRLRGVGRKALVVALTAWLGLIGWSQVAPGGPMPGPKADPGGVRVVTWNILCGQDDGPPW